MTATKRYINQLRHECRMDIDKALEMYILSQYEEEPFPFVWTEQDLHEQIRKLVIAYNDGRLSIPPIPSKYRRLKNRYEELRIAILHLAQLYFERRGELPEDFDWLSPVVGASTLEEVKYENQQ